MDSGHLDLLAAQAYKLHPTVAHYPQVSLVIFGPLPRVRSFLWDTGGTEESLLARLLIQSWACSPALERVVWTDLLRLGDARFDKLEPTPRECLYARLISPWRWMLFLRGLLGADLLRPALPPDGHDPVLSAKTMKATTIDDMARRLMHRKSLRLLLPTPIVPLFTAGCRMAPEGRGKPRHLLPLEEFQVDLYESPVHPTKAKSMEIPPCYLTVQEGSPNGTWETPADILGKAADIARWAFLTFEPGPPPTCCQNEEGLLPAWPSLRETATRALSILQSSGVSFNPTENVPQDLRAGCGFETMKTILRDHYLHWIRYLHTKA